jgi:imidazolonepropionase-like amidohydrolase
VLVWAVSEASLAGIGQSVRVPGTTIFRAARVWDGAAASPLFNGFVLVDGDRIDAVGRWAELEDSTTPGAALSAVPIVDCGDATLLPGLINAHVHVTLSGSGTVLADYLAERDAGVEILTARAIANLRAAAATGTTTVRDCGTLNDVAFAVRADVERGAIDGPRVLTCGAGLTTRGGHCHFFCHEVDTTAELRAAVAEQAHAGADFIKVFATGGNITPGTDPFAPQYSAAQLRAVVEAAHDAGLAVAAHAHAPEGIANAVAAGVDTIEHCFFETADGVAYDPALVEEIARHGIVVSPTVVGRKPLPPEEIEALLAASPNARRLWPRIPEIRGNARKMFDAGVVLIGGNDAGAVGGISFELYALGVAAMADFGPFPVGLSPLDALRASTSLAARACGLIDTGRLDAGLRADLLAVDGNPLDHITDLEHVKLVICNGRVAVDPTSIATSSH